MYAQPAETFPTHTPDGKEVLVELADLGNKASAAARKLLNAQRLAYRLTTELGDPAEVIASTAGSERVDEIVMGSGGLGQWEGLIVGSVTYKVHSSTIPSNHRCACPESAAEGGAAESAPFASRRGRF